MAKSLADTYIVPNCTVVNSRVLTPVHRSFGSQYTLLAKCDTDGLTAISKGNPDGSHWINSNAAFPNGDPTPLIQVFNHNLRPLQDTELGEGTKCNLLFDKVVTNKGTYYNIKAIQVLEFIKPFDILDAFRALDNTETDEAF